jgi:hypothetical protein
MPRRVARASTDPYGPTSASLPNLFLQLMGIDSRGPVRVLLRDPGPQMQGARPLHRLRPVRVHRNTRAMVSSPLSSRHSIYGLLWLVRALLSRARAGKPHSPAQHARMSNNVIQTDHPGPSLRCSYTSAYAFGTSRAAVVPQSTTAGICRLSGRF